MKWTTLTVTRSLTIKIPQTSIWTKMMKMVLDNFTISLKIQIKKMTMIIMAKETHSKSQMIKTLTWTTFQQVKIEQTATMPKKRKMRMKANTIQMMTMMTWMRIWSSWKSLRRKCSSSKCPNNKCPCNSLLHSLNNSKTRHFRDRRLLHLELKNQTIPKISRFEIVCSIQI